jgi:biotin operon repressor
MFGNYQTTRTCEKYLKVVVFWKRMDQDEKDILKRYMVDACVKVANNCGCCDAVGVLRGTLFLADGPISMDELVEETGYSKSTVSANMSTLERMGLARRVVIARGRAIIRKRTLRRWFIMVFAIIYVVFRAGWKSQ